MQLRYSYRIEPTPRQRIAFLRAFGCVRVVSNNALRMRNDAHHSGLPFVADADARREFHHRPSTQIIRDNQAVFVEDLAVKGLARTAVAKSVQDAGWSAFVGMLEYKAKLYGRTFAKVSRWFPSSKLCSTCGAVAERMPLSVRSWTCACGAVHDRDVNAAIRILVAGRADKSNACGGPVGPDTRPARPDEAGSHGSAAA